MPTINIMECSFILGDEAKFLNIIMRQITMKNNMKRNLLSTLTVYSHMECINII